MGIGNLEQDRNWPTLFGFTARATRLHTDMVACGTTLIAIRLMLVDKGNPLAAIAGGASRHGHGSSSHHTLRVIHFLHEGFAHPCSSYHSYSWCHLWHHYSQIIGASSTLLFLYINPKLKCSPFHIFSYLWMTFHPQSNKFFTVLHKFSLCPALNLWEKSCTMQRVHKSLPGKWMPMMDSFIMDQNSPKLLQSLSNVSKLNLP